MSERSEAHVGSGLVMTVTGPIPVAELGMTLTHEHILNDVSCWWNPDGRPGLADAPLAPGILWELREDPFACRDNLGLRDEEAAVEELGLFAAEGGRSAVDPTCRGIGRDPAALHRIAEATGLNLVMGSGYYLQASHPPALAAMSEDDVADQIVRGGHGRRRRRAHRPDRRDRRLVRLHSRRAEVPPGSREGAVPHRPAADGPPPGLVPPRP